MKKNRPIGRIIACVIAGVLVVAGAFFLVEAYRIRQEFYRQSETRPLDLAVDLSQPGEFTAPFKQTWQACHGQAINLHVPTNALAGVSPADLLASLDFTWQIADADGKVVADNDSASDLLWDNKPYGDTIPLAYFWPVDLGEYTFSCSVVTGAPVLVGLEQHLVCQYQPCGLEMLAAVFCTGIGIAALVIAGMILLIVRAVTRRKRRDQTTTESTVSPEGAPSEEP